MAEGKTITIIQKGKIVPLDTGSVRIYYHDSPMSCVTSIGSNPDGPSTGQFTVYFTHQVEPGHSDAILGVSISKNSYHEKSLIVGTYDLQFGSGEGMNFSTMMKAICPADMCIADMQLKYISTITIEKNKTTDIVLIPCWDKMY